MNTDKERYTPITSENLVENPVFSIIVLTYKRPEMLALTLEAIYKRMSNTVPFEVIVGDNNSKDTTPEIISRYPVNKVVLNKQNINMDLYKDLYELAIGEYLLEIDDDVLELPQDYDLVFLKYFSVFPDFGALALDVVQDQYTDGRKLSRYIPIEREGLVVDEGFAGGWALCIKRELFEKGGKFGTEQITGRTTEDGIIMNIVKNNNLRFGLIKDIKCYHASGEYYAKKFGYLEREMEKFRMQGFDHHADMIKQADEFMQKIENLMRKYEAGNFVEVLNDIELLPYEYYADSLMEKQILEIQGFSSLSLGLFEDARRVLERVLEKWQSGAAYAGLGEIAFRNNNPGKARQLFSKALELEPNLPLAKRRLKEIPL